MLGLALLRSATESPAFAGLASEVEAADERTFQWMLDGGLGPLLWHASRNGFDLVGKDRADALRSADLTARVRTSALVQTAVDALDTCNRLGVVATLLKGVATSDQLYPEKHLRPMGDVDLLVPAPDRPRVEKALVDNGYIPQPGYELNSGARHGIPLCHPVHRAWVEIHSDLVEQAPVDGTLGRDRAARDSVPAFFQGREVLRLRDELQLLYASYAWMMDMARYSIRVQPSGLPPLIDIARLLCENGGIDLDVLLSRTDNELALACTYTVVSYVARRSPWLSLHEVEAGLGRSQRLTTSLNIRLTHAMLDQYLLGGRPWASWLPPPVTGRYSVRSQWLKRVRKERLGHAVDE